MKFVHVADAHLDTSFISLSNSGNLGDMRRLDQRKIFKKMVDYVKENNIDFLFIAGDLYEHNYIRESTIQYINNLFKEIPETKIIITPGNHDPLLKNSFYNKFFWSENVKIFGPKMECVELEGIDIYGYGFDDFYFSYDEFNNFEIKNPQKINILITHADLNGTNNTEKQYNAVSEQVIKSKGFDYVALGHIHKPNYFESTKIVYPGSMCALGFDEPGEHGMIVGEINESKVLEKKFVKLDMSEFVKKDVDISRCKAIEDIIQLITNAVSEPCNYFEINLVGDKNFDIDLYKLKRMIDVENVVKIKDSTKIPYSLESLASETTLKGLFVKEILEQLKNGDHDSELLKEALEIGLEILEK